MTYEFRLLGPLEVRSDGRIVPVTSAKQRVLLAALLVDANRVVSVDELANRLWDNESTSRNTLHSYVMRLRRTLGDKAPLITRPDGYLIEVAPDTLDTTLFESWVRQARTDEPARAATLLRQALDLWRGEPLADIQSEYLRREVAPLWQERRLAAVESLIDADLRLGRHQDVATELADLTTRHPLRERFWVQRMLALYRSGRTAEALRCYTEVRAVLADELGADPSPELRDLHQAILTDDQSLAIPVPTRPRRNDLPGDIPDFVGRAEEFDRLLAVLRTPTKAVVTSAIDGMAGTGKTTLAIHAAHRLADRYPDAQLFLDLRAHSEDSEPIEPAVALDTLLRALNVPPDRIPDGLDERAALWRAELADRKVLLLLDNAATTSQLRPLLPGSPTCLALITSRRRLATWTPPTRCPWTYCRKPMRSPCSRPWSAPTGPTPIPSPHRTYCACAATCRWPSASQPPAYAPDRHGRCVHWPTDYVAKPETNSPSETVASRQRWTCPTAGSPNHNSDCSPCWASILARPSTATRQQPWATSRFLERNDYSRNSWMCIW